MVSTAPTPTPQPARPPRVSNGQLAAIVAVSIVVLLVLLGVFLNWAFSSRTAELHGDPSGQAQWPLTYDFDDRSSDMGLASTPGMSSEYTDDGLLLTVKSAEPPQKFTGVNFYDAHPSLAVEMDMTLRSGPIDGTAYGPSCWTGDEFFVFFVSDVGSYQLSASDYSGTDVSVSATTPLASGSDPSLVGTRSRRLRIECEPDASATTISGYADGHLIATVTTATRVGRSLNSNEFIRGAAVARTTGPPAQIFIDNFRAEHP